MRRSGNAQFDRAEKNIKPTAMRCIVCDQDLEMVGPLQPYGGVHFHSYGHYGSTVFDPMDGVTSWNIAVCDACLVSKMHCVCVNRAGQDNDVDDQ